jgi:hypothetical protein
MGTLLNFGFQTLLLIDGSMLWCSRPNRRSTLSNEEWNYGAQACRRLCEERTGPPLHMTITLISVMQLKSREKYVKKVIGFFPLIFCVSFLLDTVVRSMVQNVKF